MNRYRKFVAVTAAASALLAALANIPANASDFFVPGTPLPPSDFLSPEARAALVARQQLESSMLGRTDLSEVDKATETAAARTLAEWLKIYPANIEDLDIDGVRVYVVTPSAGIDKRNARRVLLSAHQGGFLFGARNSALLEAVPLAGRGRVKVIAVDYRKAPAFAFPAASEDMEKVYRHELRATRAANIGLYGCSAGGTLVAQAVSRFQARSLPRPGAISIQCSGAANSFWFGGDSNALNGAFSGRPPLKAMIGSYFQKADMNDPLVSPATHPNVLAKFPPTLLVSGTRDIALSNLLMTHTALLQAGVDARLFLQEGLGHGHFYLFPGTPESRVAYDVIWKFFDTQLGR